MRSIQMFSSRTRIVTAPMGRKRVKIPDACMAMGVDVTTVFEMMRWCGVQSRFPEVLGPARF